MLYKKYHRSYIKQFKKGIKFNIRHRFPEKGFIKGEPFIKYDWGISITDSENFTWLIVFFDGTINSEVRIKEDAIQKISQKLH